MLLKTSSSFKLRLHTQFCKIKKTEMRREISRMENFAACSAALNMCKKLGGVESSWENGFILQL